MCVLQCYCSVVAGLLQSCCNIVAVLLQCCCSFVVVCCSAITRQRRQQLHARVFEPACSVLQLWQCVAVFCSVSQYCCNVLQCDHTSATTVTACSVLRYCCSIVAVCFSVLQCVAVLLQCVAVCYSVLQCVAVCCSVRDAQ